MPRFDPNPEAPGGGRLFGFDQWIESLGRGGSPAVVLSVAVLLGLRHATDPDHLVAVSTIVATDRDRPWKRASELGLAWGLGHATTLVLLGLPIVVLDRYLPDAVQRGAEVLAGALIVALAVRLLRRWRNGFFHSHEHEHDGVVHRHLHGHADAGSSASGNHRHEHRVAHSSTQAYGVGLVHGIGGSAGVGLLLLASIQDRTEAIAALALFASATAASMALLSLGGGYLLAAPAVRRRLPSVVPGFGALAVVFGVWYALGAVAS
jgi:high-affinity nickel permease